MATGKAGYTRGVDEGEAALVRSILHADCSLNYIGCIVDPKTGKDFFPAMSIVVEGRDKFGSALAHLGIVSVHQVYNGEIELTGETAARASGDRLYFPEGSPYAAVTGYGHYRETYEKVGGAWPLKTTKVTRVAG